jgi:hypothetical protein
MEDAKQAQALDRENVVCIPGMLETDFKFVQYFYDGKPLIDTQKLAEGLGINGAMDAYADQFLTSEIGDSTANRYLGRVKGETLFQGERPDMYNNLVKTIAMEELSLRRILEARRRGDASNGVYKDKLVQAVHEALSKLPPLPPEVRATLEHQLLWNVAYGAQQKAKVGAMDPVEAKRIMGHTALGVKYGEGFVTVEPGEALVVKEGRENDAVPLGTARKVLQKVRAHTMPNDKLPLLVHVNSKTAGGITNEPSLRTQVGSRIATMQLFVREAFEGTDFNVMKTFSTEHDNLWIPTNQGNGASTFPIDMTHGMNGADFSIAELHAREMLYRDNMAFVGKISEGILAKK